MLAGTLLFVLGAALPIIWTSYTAFVLTLVSTTIGYLIFIPSMQAYLGDQVSYKRRGLAIAVTEMGWSLSFIIGVPIVGVLIERLGWRSPFPLLVALGLIAFIVFTRILPAGEKSPNIRPSVMTNLTKVFTYPLALAGLASGMLFSTANETINLIFGVWLEENFSLKITALGMVALAIGMAEFAGEGFVGILTDRLGKIRSINIGLVLNCLALLILLTMSRWLGGALIGLFIFYLTFEFTLVSAIPLMSEVLPPARHSDGPSEQFFLQFCTMLELRAESYSTPLQRFSSIFWH
jgi:predicted MFS family arabinose efflux permease